MLSSSFLTSVLPLVSSATHSALPPQHDTHSRVYNLHTMLSHLAVDTVIAVPSGPALMCSTNNPPPTAQPYINDPLGLFSSRFFHL